MTYNAFLIMTQNPEAIQKKTDKYDIKKNRTAKSKDKKGKTNTCNSY